MWRPALRALRLVKDQNTTLGRSGRVVRVEPVTMLSLEQLWAHAGLRRPQPASAAVNVSLERVDILVIDAEGAEVQILGGPEGLPWPRPALILFEHAHLSRQAQQLIDGRLRGQGYERLADIRNQDPRGRRSPPANRLYGRKLRIRDSTPHR